MSNPLNGILGSSGGGSGGSGDVVGPASATDFGIAYFDDTTGKLLAGSAATITAAGSLTIPSAETIEFSTDTGLARTAAGVINVTNGGAGQGSFSAFQFKLGTLGDAYFQRVQWGNISAAASGSTVASINQSRAVEANTEGSGSPNVLTHGESNKVLTNEGSTAKNYHTLPSAIAGSTAPFFTFIVQDADGLRITAAAGDDIRVIDKVTAAAGYIESTTIGSVVTLVAINANEWIATSIHGVWTDGTFTYDDTSLTTP